MLLEGEAELKGKTGARIPRMIAEAIRADFQGTLKEIDIEEFTLSSVSTEQERCGTSNLALAAPF